MSVKALNAFAQSVYEMVMQIPRGQVASYSQVGTYLGSPGLARAVGNALRELTPAQARVVPWHRVIKADGTLAFRGDVRRQPVQERLLRKEGVVIDARGRVPMELFGWAGPTSAHAVSPRFRAPEEARRPRVKKR